MFGTFMVQAQIKGTNAIGLGLTFQTSETQSLNWKGESKNAGMSIGYGYFFKENEKIGVNVFYGLNKSTEAFGDATLNPSSWRLNSYGGSFAYQKYFALVKKLYAFAGPRIGYNYAQNNNQLDGQKINTYSVGANGGVSWFFSKRFALEADLLAADISYTKSEQNSPTTAFKHTSTSFNLSSSGAFNGLGFKIYYIF